VNRVREYHVHELGRRFVNNFREFDNSAMVQRKIITIHRRQRPAATVTQCMLSEQTLPVAHPGNNPARVEFRTLVGRL
jgi:hypothetical protein